jgi:hypothetical protein
MFELSELLVIDTHYDYELLYIHIKLILMHTFSILRRLAARWEAWRLRLVDYELQIQVAFWWNWNLQFTNSLFINLTWLENTDTAYHLSKFHIDCKTLLHIMISFVDLSLYFANTLYIYRTYNGYNCSAGGVSPHWHLTLTLVSSWDPSSQTLNFVLFMGFCEIDYLCCFQILMYINSCQC